jgi:hypothetical protein
MESTRVSPAPPLAGDPGDTAGSCAVLALEGHAGIADCDWFPHLLGLLASRPPGRLVVDLSGVSSIDWWVALMLQWARRFADRRRVTLELASPQPAVARALTAVDEAASS